ncbi:MAG: ABC transporter permease [bacterium]|nr:ABC transporter permease [bacterium]
MKWLDIRADLRDFWQEFRQVHSGIVSLLLLGGFLLLIFFEPWLIPFPEAGKRWRDISYWENNPRNAPPLWINWFSSAKYATGTEIHESTRSEKQAGKMTILRTEFLYQYDADIPPRDILFHCRAYGSPVLIISIERPDGEKLRLFKKSVSRAENQKIRISVDKDAKDDVYTFAARYEKPEDRLSKGMIRPSNLIFAQAREGLFRSPQALKGEYRIISEVLLPKDEDRVEALSLRLPGSVSGLLGTDNSKRDIWSGVVTGIRWALLIGVFTAVAAVSVGVVYGVMSAYFGGWRDSLMQRIFEVFVSIPLLPLLIVMSAIFKPSIWTMMLMMSCFFWVGPVKTVRSMGLQIKEESYIEASKAFGASSFRIIFKHMIPLLVPYAFASMALYVPGAIVYESTISLLGLGDSTIVTWGQILHDALSGGAVLNGQWWWVVPPGLAIALMGMTFAFLGFAMDTILHPKLRTR